MRPSSATTRDAKIAGTQLAIGLAFLASFTFFAVRARFPIPYRDDWDWLEWLLTHSLTLKTLFEPHNEHMIPLLRLLLALQYRLEGSGTRLVFVVAMASQIALAWTFVREIQRRWPGDRQTRHFALGTMAVCLFFAHQLQSVVFMAAVLFPLVQAFAVLAVVCTLNALEPGANRRAWFATAAAAAAAAALTTTNGLAAPLILAWLVWIRRGPRSGMVLFAAAGLAGLAAYVLMVGRPWVHAPVPAGGIWALPSISEMAAFFLTFYSSALAYGSLKAAVVLGTALFALGSFALFDAFRRRDSTSRIELFAICVMLFATASAAMATPARAQFGALQAAQSRYASYAMAFNAALFLWGLSRVSPLEWWNRFRPAGMLLITVGSAVVLVGHMFIGTVWIAKADNIGFVKHALAAQVKDDAWIATLHPLTWIVYGAADRLRIAGDPLVSDPRVGERWPALPVLDTCEGTLTLMSLGPRVGWRLTGALAIRTASGIVVDKSSIVRGLAAPAPLVDAPNPFEPQVVDAVWHSIGRPTPAERGWLGFVQRGDGAPFTFYGLSAEGKPVCRAPVGVRQE